MNEISVSEALNEKHRSKSTSEKCFGCKNSYQDIEEGWLCKKYDAHIKLVDGSVMKWPGQACDNAFNNDCHGNGFERHLIPAIMRKHPFISILIFGVVFAQFMVSFCRP